MAVKQVKIGSFYSDEDILRISFKKRHLFGTIYNEKIMRILNFCEHSFLSKEGMLK